MSKFRYTKLSIFAFFLALYFGQFALAQNIVPAPILGNVTSPQKGAVQQNTIPTRAPQITFVDDEYLIGPQDLIRIEVFQVEDLSRSVRVSSRGHISLPLIGIVQAAGMTAPELEQALADKLSLEFLQNPYVTVFIEEYTSQRVTIEGEVKKPGVFALAGRTSLLQVIALAEGLDELADQNQIQLFRSNGQGAREILYYDVEAIRKGENPDPLLKGEDIIVVHKSEPRSTFKKVTDALRGFIFFGGSL